MKFFVQKDDTSCQIIALQIVLSNYKIYKSAKEIKCLLPTHSFGNLITELGVFLELLGIKTKLISNSAKIRPSNKLFWKSLEEYKHSGTYDDRNIIDKDLSEQSILVNVDWYKIKKAEKGRGAHYVVLNMENKKIWLYDGSNYKRKVKTSLERIIAASKDINKWHDDGMWLLIRN